MKIRTWRWFPWWSGWYPLHKAIAFLRDTGFNLYLRGFVWPLTRDGGFVIGWLQKVSIGAPDSDQGDDS